MFIEPFEDNILTFIGTHLISFPPSPTLVVQVLKEFLRFAEAEVRTLASLYSSVVGAASRCICSNFDTLV